MDDFTFTLGRISDAAVADLAPDFDSLPTSDYADGSYRLRRYSRFAFDRGDGTLDLLPPREFVQGDDINHFQGNVPRHYDDLLDTTWATDGFRELCGAFAEIAGLPERSTIEVHQLRVISQDPGDVAEAAPEGVHQDGFDRIAIATLGRANSSGANVSLHEASDLPALATLRQAPGQFVVLADHRLWHSADPVVAVDSGRPGYWDCLVLTSNLA